MIKKYAHFILIITAGLLLWCIYNYRSGSNSKPSSPRIHTPANGEEFNRHAARIIYTKHARCRMGCRHIDESEVMEVIEKGSINYTKIEQDDRGKTYPLEGWTHDEQHVRIVVAPKNENLVVVTVIDLDKDWYCDCKQN